MSIAVDAGNLTVRFGERDPVPLVALSEKRFAWPGPSLVLEFDEVVDGIAPGLALGTAGLYGSHLTRVAKD